MLDKLFQLNIVLARTFAQVFGYELAITIDEHEIKLEVVDPDNIEERAFDSSHFVSGNIFVGDFANPINISNIEEAYKDAEYIVSDRYKKYMEQELIDDIVQTSKDSGLTVTQATLVIGTLQLLSVAVIYVVG